MSRTPIFPGNILYPKDLRDLFVIFIYQAMVVIKSRQYSTVNIPMNCNRYTWGYQIMQSICPLQNEGFRIHVH